MSEEEGGDRLFVNYQDTGTDIAKVYANDRFCLSKSVNRSPCWNHFQAVLWQKLMSLSGVSDNNIEKYLLCSVILWAPRPTQSGPQAALLLMKDLNYQ